MSLRLFSALLLFTSAGVSLADAPELNVVAFVACPIYRDTDSGRKSGCWLAEDPATGIRYDVTDAPTKPQVGKMSYFEGIATGDRDTCGGIVLRPVRSSVLEDTCPRAIIPAEQFKGRPFILPDEVLKPTWEPRVLPMPPYTTKEFHIVFDLGSDFHIYQYAELILEKISLYVKASRPKAVIVTGYAATKPIDVSGRSLAEPLSLARSRAEGTAEALTRLGVDRELIRVTTDGDPRPLTMLNTPGLESSKRRVTVRIEVD
jgi:outer membrane protein OmpA-like peptidoglycan-associated protein